MKEVLLNTLQALLVVGISGTVFGYLLSLASSFFAVKVDKKVEECLEVLPGANCGGCGYSGCAAYAAAVAGGAPLNCCNAGGQPVADKLAEITGRTSDKVSEKKAFVYCSGGGSGKFRYTFFGMDSCIPACRVDGGPHVCSFACVGLGSCTKVCKFHAISITNGVAKVNQALCTGCGACVAECPKGIIGLVPAEQNVAVPCRSHMKGADTMKSCDLGCIGCKKCEKTCENGAIIVTDSLAVIDYEKCTSCGKCFEVCPRHLITNIHGSPFVKSVSPFADMDIPEPVIPAATAAPVPKSKKPPVKPMPVPGAVPVFSVTPPKPVIPTDPAELPNSPASPVASSTQNDAPLPASVVDEIISRITPAAADAAEPSSSVAPDSPAPAEVPIDNSFTPAEAPAAEIVPSAEPAQPSQPVPPSESEPVSESAPSPAPFPNDPEDDLDRAFASLVEEKTGDSEPK